MATHMYTHVEMTSLFQVGRFYLLKLKLCLSFTKQTLTTSKKEIILGNVAVISITLSS